MVWWWFTPSSVKYVCIFSGTPNITVIWDSNKPINLEHIYLLGGGVLGRCASRLQDVWICLKTFVWLNFLDGLKDYYFIGQVKFSHRAVSGEKGSHILHTSCCVMCNTKYANYGCENVWFLILYGARNNWVIET